ncbi:adenosylmethionine--8-amino-7-oxononanoate transaminase [Sphingomonas sp. SRS2]|uniref:adenosylmethionine--8-amino-7-oxononanoate transaminase n=1 Tax=Sphingomonas sp. SRS2 TaxID=133190 RepID=UPI0006184EB1|nr:adenosylmethionine--8-amino-7-oxononanoate transaminase [Sphingomonas sp. SRS2]KKC25308.1 adenosylmethionine-8-amino-7-oxononanoate aminotransferase [Sphingomonas sp. SRS2]
MTSPVWHPFTQHGLGEDIPLVVRAQGAALYTVEGRRYIDAISSWWVTTHGHCDPRIMAAIRDQTQHLDQLIFAGWTHQPAETLAQDLVDITPGPLAHVFFSDSGSTSVEVALKMALGYWLNRGEPRHRIAVMEHSYHGDTIGAMSVGERGVYNRAYQPLLFDVDTIPFPTGDGDAAIAALERLCAKAPPAALIVEPLILGAGGMLIYAPHVLKALRDVCARAGVLFIADEVMTGWGRTGTLFACEQAEVAPDIMCLSKGLTGGAVPLAATLATREIFDAHRSDDRGKMFFHSSSYTANPIACAAANANLAIWRDEPVRRRILDLSYRQTRRLTALDHPAIVNKRQLGTITAMEFVDPYGDYLSAMAPVLGRFFRDRGLLLRPMGNTVYVMPPYCIDDADLDAIYEAILAAAREVAI